VATSVNKLPGRLINDDRAQAAIRPLNGYQKIITKPEVPKPYRGKSLVPKRAVCLVLLRQVENLVGLEHTLNFNPFGKISSQACHRLVFFATAKLNFQFPRIDKDKIGVCKAAKYQPRPASASS